MYMVKYTRDTVTLLTVFAAAHGKVMYIHTLLLASFIAKHRMSGFTM